MNSDILDRPIAFHRCFVTLTGSVNAALMLSQAVYWQKRNREGGWWYQTQEKWEDETGLSRREQETARRDLRKTPFWNEELRGLPGKLNYFVDLEMLMDSLMELQHRQTSMAESAIQDCTNPPNSIGGNRQTSNKEKRLNEETKEERTHSTRFREPTRDEVLEEAKAHWMPEIEADKFLNYYGANGWKVGRNPMKCWKRAFATWRLNWQERYKPKGELKEMKDPGFKIKIATFE